MNQKTVDIKIFKILSYVSILWIVGLISPYRNEKDVQFHVDQGKILTVFFVILLTLSILIDKVLLANIFVTKIMVNGTDIVKYVRNDAGIILGQTIKIFLMLVYIVYSAIGIRNATLSANKTLPFIGRYSFKWRRK